MTLLVGLPGQGMHLGIDPLSGLFLCLLAPLVLACAIVGPSRSVAFWVFVLGTAAAVLAADAFTLILGFGLMSAAAWFLALHGGWRAMLLVAAALFCGFCLVGAMYLPLGSAAFLLLLLGVGAMSCLALVRFQPPPDGLPAPVAALLSGGILTVSLYVLIRYALVVFGTAGAAWWGGALLAAGAAAMLFGAARAVLQTEIEALLAGAAVAQLGSIAAALGIALSAKAMTNPALATLAVQAALLGGVGQALFTPLLWLGAGAVREATGTTSLDWLGGLMRGMPKVGLLMLFGAAGMAALPLGPGFPALFLLLHAVIAGAAAGGLWAALGFAVLLAALGFGVALLQAAALRLIGIGFLGRPRSLRAAAAEEADRRTLLGIGFLAALCLPLALLPGLLLAALHPVVMLLVPGAPALPLPYAPLPVAVLMLAVAGAAWFGLRRYGARGEREAPAWNGGFGKPPIWLPFGDPQTQPSGSGFAAPARAVLGWFAMPRAAPGKRAALSIPAPRRMLRWRARLHRAAEGHRLALAFGIFVVALLALRLGQGN